jgi:hypothetical protein
MAETHNRSGREVHAKGRDHLENRRRFDDNIKMNLQKVG